MRAVQAAAEFLFADLGDRLLSAPQQLDLERPVLADFAAWPSLSDC